jgi:hypothetical protein
VTRLSFWHT